ncbi:hypothetical protein ACLMJK_001144 [Lecanora helva]
MAAANPRVAFAGLGAMGYGMASHLVKSGFQVTGYDVYRPSLDKIIAVGGHAAESPRDAVKDADFFICMVATSIQATPLLFDPAYGAVISLPQNATILLCSTVAPAYIDEVSQGLKDAGRSDVRLIDCPVSGGAGRAADGTLSIFSSGDDADLAKAHPILACMSTKLYKIPGGLGGGSKAKLIHQVLAGIHIAMGSETMGLAAAAGLNTIQAFDILRKSEGNSWMFTNRVPPMLDRTMPPYSAINIITKDVGIITTTSRAFKHPLPLLSTSEQLYLTGISAGWGKEDDCVMVRLYLPDRPDLVAQQALASFENARSPIVSAIDIRNLMIAVHLAAVSEAMSFCEVLGIDTDLMFDIVSNAAGASDVFLKYFQPMQQGKWSLKSVPEVEEIRRNLMEAIDKAYELRYPLFLSSAALQEFNRQL